MSNSSHSPAAPIGGRKLQTDKTSVMSTRRRVRTNWVSDMKLQLSTVPVVVSIPVPSDLLVGGSR